MSNQYGAYDIDRFVAEFYDVSYDIRNDRDVIFYVDYAKKAGGRTLEMGCGTGRVLIPTAAAGCTITGLDLSTFMLEKCRDKLAQQPLEVQKRAKLIKGNMTDFNIGEKFDLITIPFRPFQHLLTVAQQNACLGCVQKHLKPRGLFVFDVFNPNPARLVPGSKYEEEIEDMPETRLPDGRKLRRANRLAGLHRDIQVNDIEIIYYITHPDGRQERLVEAFPMRYYFRHEIEHLLELGGFKIVDLFGDFDKSPFTNNSPEMIFVTKKE